MILVLSSSIYGWCMVYGCLLMIIDDYGCYHIFEHWSWWHLFAQILHTQIGYAILFLRCGCPKCWLPSITLEKNIKLMIPYMWFFGSSSYKWWCPQWHVCWWINLISHRYTCHRHPQSIVASIPRPPPSIVRACSGYIRPRHQNNRSSFARKGPHW